MSVLFHLINLKNNPVKGRTRILIKWIKKVVENNQKKIGDINIIFCSNDYILDLNKRFLNHNYYTDVITFPYSENDILSGDIFISIDQVKSNSKEFKATFNEELHRVIIHGILHIIGFNDETDQERMHMHVLEDKALMLLEEMQKL